MGVAMSHQVVMHEDKVTEEDQDMSVDNVEQDVTSDEDSDQYCEEVSLHMQYINYFPHKIMFCFAGCRTGCDLGPQYCTEWSSLHVHIHYGNVETSEITFVSHLSILSKQVTPVPSLSLRSQEISPFERSYPYSHWRETLLV